MEAPSDTRAVDVEVDNLCKSYNGQRVICDLDFRVEAGDIFVLMGPSGSGKSVLLRQIIGLESPERGEVRIAGLNAADPETLEQFVCALVFQAGALFNSMSVYDNLALYLREHRRGTEKVIREKVMDALQALKLENAQDKIPAELSGGMRKRVAVARAIVMEPQLILYDEPTSELDPLTAAAVSELIAEVQQRTNATTIVVTHDRDLAMNIGDRVGLLMKGQLVFLGTPAELQACEEPRVKAFLNPTIRARHREPVAS